MVEMEHLYDGIRSVRHDMKNHMAVLQNLIRKRYSGEDEEIRLDAKGFMLSGAEAYITIWSFRANNMYFIEIENSFDGAALTRKDSGLLISTKGDKEVHGIGLKNIRKCAVKYGGDMDCIVKGNRFILSVMVKS